MERFGDRGSLTNESFLLEADKTASELALLLPGRILAKRYKILEVINAGAFKAHDLVLDQSVNVTQVISACHRDRAFWCQKIRQLTRFRNAYCLNVLNVVRELWSDYVITERPRGKTIAELLYERSPFFAEDVPDLIRHLAGAIDILAVTGAWSSVDSSRLVYAQSQYSYAACPEEGACPDQSQFSQSTRFSLKLDVWEVVRPRTNNSRRRCTFSIVQKLGLQPAVRQLALLTYKLFGGEAIGYLDAGRSFTPICQLGRVGNSRELVTCCGERSKSRRCHLFWAAAFDGRDL